MRSLEDCSVFFFVRAGRRGLVLLSAGRSGFGGSRGRFRTVLGNVSGSATEEAQFVVETALSFLRCQFAVFPEFRGKVGSGLLWVGRRALALGRARIVLLLGLGFARLVVSVGGIRFVVQLV